MWVWTGGVICLQARKCVIIFAFHILCSFACLCIHVHVFLPVAVLAWIYILVDLLKKVQSACIFFCTVVCLVPKFSYALMLSVIGGTCTLFTT